jgi:hypothetical protein
MYGYCKKEEFYCQKGEKDCLLYQEGGVQHKQKEKKRAWFILGNFYSTLNLEAGRD